MINSTPLLDEQIDVFAPCMGGAVEPIVQSQDPRPAITSIREKRRASRGSRHGAVRIEHELPRHPLVEVPVAAWRLVQRDDRCIDSRS